MIDPAVTPVAMLAMVAMVASIAGCHASERCGGRIEVCDGAVRDGDGRALVLRGVNLGAVHRNAPYTDDFVPADYDRLRADWGFSAIRFLITWAAIEPSPGVYDDAYLDWIAERMAWADAAGLAVIIDMHQDVFGEGFGFAGAPRWACDAARYDAFVRQDPWSANYAEPNVIACFDQFWTSAELRGHLAAATAHVAQRLAAAPAVIGFEPMNEPSWGSYPVTQFEPDRLQPFYREVIAAVRREAPHWLAFVEPSNARNLGFATHLAAFDEPDVVYAPHLYDELAETTGHFDPARREEVIANAADLADEAARIGVPLLLGEYGGVATDPDIASYLDADNEGAAAVGAGALYWSYDRGDGYSLLDLQGNEVAPLVSAIVRAAPERVDGTLASWSYDAATRSLEVRWHRDRSIAAPTILAAPQRLYPGGIDVDCGGCAVTIDGNRVEIADTPGDPAIVRLRPR